MLFENKVTAYTYRQFKSTHALSTGKDEYLTVNGILQRQFIQTRVRRTKNVATVGYKCGVRSFTLLTCGLNELLHVLLGYVVLFVACCVPLKD